MNKYYTRPFVSIWLAVFLTFAVGGSLAIMAVSGSDPINGSFSWSDAFNGLSGFFQGSFASAALILLSIAAIWLLLRIGRTSYGENTSKMLLHIIILLFIAYLVLAVLAPKSDLTDGRVWPTIFWMLVVGVFVTLVTRFIVRQFAPQVVTTSA